MLTQGMQLFIGQTNSFEWGKKEYGPTENGGISGIIYYANTRAENDPRYAVGDPWEPGIPRVQVNLYADGGAAGSSLTPLPDGVIDDLNGDGSGDPGRRGQLPVQLAPGSSVPGGRRDREPGVDRGPWNRGRRPQRQRRLRRRRRHRHCHHGQLGRQPADRLPRRPRPTSFYQNGKCYDGLRNFNQVRPGVFDGGYAFTEYVPGGVAAGAAPR